MDCSDALYCSRFVGKTRWYRLFKQGFVLRRIQHLLWEKNVVDHTEVLWQDFRKFAINHKPHEISSPEFWALTIQQFYKECREPILINMILEEVFLSFKTIKSYSLLDQKSFGPIKRLLQHMLALILSESLYLKQHLETSIVFDPMLSTHVSFEPISDKGKAGSSRGNKKKAAKSKSSPCKPKAKKV